MPFVKVPKKREPLWKQHDQLAQKEGLRHAVYETNGSKYVGEWKDNMKHGKGEQHYSQTDQLYDGDWRLANATVLVLSVSSTKRFMLADGKTTSAAAKV